MGVMDWLQRFLGGTRRPETTAPTPGLSPAPDAALSAGAVTTRIEDAPTVASATPIEPDAMVRSAERRDQFWAEVGMVEPDVLSHLISPSLMGGPAWPTTRQAYRIIRRADGAIIVATDGMSDPFDDGREGNGFGLELFIESVDLPAELSGTPGDIDPIKRSWMFELLQNVATTIAGAGGVLTQLDTYGVLSMEIPGVSQSYAIREQLLEEYVTADDAIGILIGAPAPDFTTRIDDMPLSSVRIIPVVLLMAAELGEIRAGDGKTRDAIAARLAALPRGYRSGASRPPIL